MNPDEIIYFDNAATTFPKPPGVADAVIDYIENIGGNPGRSGHALSILSGERVFEAREIIAGLFNISTPLGIIFCSNATDALNLAILGNINRGDHIITSSLEHNSTIRPLKELERDGIITLTILRGGNNGIIEPAEFEQGIRPETSMAVINHASNAFGTVQPLREIGDVCRKRDILLIADCAQSAGAIPLDLKSMKVDLCAFAGHKGLLGPTGTGGLVISDSFDFHRMRPLKYGGTGSNSDRLYQPDFLPDVFESGTLNVAGISGLYKGVKHILSLPEGVSGIGRHKRELTRYFLGLASGLEGFIHYASENGSEAGVVSFNLEGIEPSEVSQVLSEDYRIMSRPGLHCAPLAHQRMETFPRGTVRFSFGIYNTKENIDRAVDALKDITRGRRG